MSGKEPNWGALVGIVAFVVLVIALAIGYAARDKSDFKERCRDASGDVVEVDGGSRQFCLDENGRPLRV